jgi:hypothetical protein
MDIQAAEIELKKRLLYPYKWGLKQNDTMDKATNFIYKSPTFEALTEQIDKKFCNSKNYQAMKNYSLNRWFAFKSANAIEEIFCSIEGVTAAKKFDKLVDFEIKGIKFDHKTSVCPKTSLPLEHLIENKRKIILWLYKNQSRQGREHYKNRLFILLFDRNSGEHWKLRSEISWLKILIITYVRNFTAGNLEKFNFNGEEIFSDIIWAIKD